VAAQARARKLHAAELGALLHATTLALPHDPLAAAQTAQAALALAASTEATHADRALRWLAPAQALATADPAPAGRWAQAGQEWLRTTVSAHLAPEFADSFLHQHPVNQALLAWRLVS